MSKRFIIKINDELYYMTDGDLLEYDVNNTKGDDRKKEGVKKVAKKFKDVHDEPHTWYKAVEVKDASFSAINT